MKLKHSIFLLSVSLAFSACTAGKPEFPFKDPDLPLEERVDDLLGRLTLEEKIGQMMNESPAIERLGIRKYDWWNEALHGVAFVGKSTVFPQPIAMAATFDDEGVFEVFDAVGDEGRAKYHQHLKDNEYGRNHGLTYWAPNVNIFRDPRWGRGIETYGEDPYLTSRMGVAAVKGMQGDDPRYFKAHACAKHYAVHSGPEWNRAVQNVEVSPRDLWTTYLPAFEALVKEGNVQEIMCAYNRFEGEPCCGSDKLLIDILRNRWGYDRIVLSDCGAIGFFCGSHKTHPDVESATADAVLSGTDLECGDRYQYLTKAIEKGKIKESDLDVSLRRLIRAKIQLGMFDPDERVPYAQIPFSVVESKEHVAMALKMARESIVLLKNDNQTLPLSKKVKKIAVVGPNADDSTMVIGSYNGHPTHAVTILEGIRKKMPEAEIIYTMGCGHATDRYTRSLGGYIHSGAGTGFEYAFYDNLNFEGDPVYTGCAKSIRYIPKLRSQFVREVKLTDYSARFTGVLTSPVTGDVNLSINSNKGYRLYVNDEKVAEEWEKGGSHQYVLKAETGKKYPIRLEFINSTKNTSFGFSASVQEKTDYRKTFEAVKDADVIVYVGGISPQLEGEQRKLDLKGFRSGDRTDIAVPEVQQKMVKTLKATGKPVVYVACAGSPLALNWENKYVDAILYAWYGGQEAGNAVADVVFGDYNPAGRLPVTFYKSIDQLPDYMNYNMEGRTYRYLKQTPLYPFGYGLSYTTFEQEEGRLSREVIAPDGSVRLQVKVRNTGTLDGDEVVQVYIRNENDPEGPIKSLKGFKRVHVPAGKTATVNIELPARAFESFDDQAQKMVVRPGSYQVLYGSSSADRDLKRLDIRIR